MEIRATCVFDYSSVKALTHVTMYQRIKPRIAFHAINFVAAFLVLITLFTMICFGADTQSSYQLILSAAIFLFNCFLYFLFPRTQYAALNQMKNVVNEYLFREDGIQITSKGDLYAGEAELKYPMIPKVMETSAYLFIYQSKNQVFIVDKSTITGGTVEDLRKKLQPFVKKKYILCRY